VVVGALPKVCDDAMLRQFAELYGEVDKAVVKIDEVTGNSRGFGFIEFAYTDGVDAIFSVDADVHYIAGKWVDVKRYQKGIGKGEPKGKGEAKGKGDVKGKGKFGKGKGKGAPKGEGMNSFARPSGGSDEDERTVFVGGLPQCATTETLQEYCSNYGAVESVTIKMDSETGNSRGFGFVKFFEQAAVESILYDRASHTLDGKWFEVKKIADMHFGGSKGGKGKGAKGGHDKGAKGGYGKGAKGYSKGGKGQLGGPEAAWGLGHDAWGGYDAAWDGYGPPSYVKGASSEWDYAPVRPLPFAAKGKGRAPY